LYVATRNGYFEVGRWLIENGNASVDQANKEGETPLFAAIERCSKEAAPRDYFGGAMNMLRWLIEEGNANVNKVSASGATPLLFALCLKVVNIDVVRFLLSEGARVSDLDNPVFNSCVKGFIQEEVQKLEVQSHVFSVCIYFSIF
jgi:ankyrin repeat protein